MRLPRQPVRGQVAAAEKHRFAAEARRQSQLVAESPDELEVMRWMEDVTGIEEAQSDKSGAQARLPDDRIGDGSEGTPRLDLA